MKKTLLALAVFAAAGSAQAIELYNQDGVTVALKGDIEVRYKKTFDKQDNLKQEIDDADVGFDTRYQVNDDLQIGGYIEYSGDTSDRAQGKVANGNTYVGFYSKSLGSLKFGRLDTVLDDAGIGSDYLFGLDEFFNNLQTGGEEAVRYDLDLGSVYFGAGWIQDHYEQRPSSADHHYDLKLGARVADFDFTGYYAETGLDASTETEKLAGLEARFGGIENVKLSAAYYNVSGTKESQTFALAADLMVDKWKFATAVASTDFDAAANEDFVQWFVNAGYGIAPNTTLYAEVGGNDKTNTEVGYGFGVKATF
ncbi:MULTISPECIES: porin [Vibrio]|uniref:Porin n=1 Tax=Vibrio diazotrophicus TaxID=685 RepID=A0A2J8G280_VIBDI|nr:MULTISPECIES: porin [Vibrio]MCF7362748.1 porin [Vibrio sp. A1-b2]PNH80148.1 porin [Vibrio diazotrophicus]PNI06330.1 porin [Vibrio diazotrophicus]